MKRYRAPIFLTGLASLLSAVACPINQPILNTENLPNEIRIYEEDVKADGSARLPSFSVYSPNNQGPTSSVAQVFPAPGETRQMPFTFSVEEQQGTSHETIATPVIKDVPNDDAREGDTWSGILALRGEGGMNYDALVEHFNEATPVFPTSSAAERYLPFFYSKGFSPGRQPQNISCSSNADCGTDGFAGNSFCDAENNVSQNYQTFTCSNPGTPQSSCSSSLEVRIADCCDDSNNLTIDTCVSSAQNSYCENTPFTCSSNADCDDNNPNTEDICNNPGTANSYCSNQITQTTDELARQVDAYFVNPVTGGREDTVTTNPTIMRLYMPELLEQRLSRPPAITRTEENGVGDCVDIGSYTSLTRTSPGIYDSRVTFLVGKNCPEDEVAAFVFGLETNDGNVYQNFYGSGFIPHNLPQSP